MTTDQMKTEISDGIMTMTLTRPDKKNALSKAMYTQCRTGSKLPRKTRQFVGPVVQRYFCS
jgi:hypothetical protein